ncbi:MAG: hypothetical protein IT462_13140 [Planctomycetes bacterium]|nr:hypothetical protein [Planctomycetota bacterium]
MRHFLAMFALVAVAAASLTADPTLTDPIDSLNVGAISAAPVAIDGDTAVIGDSGSARATVFVRTTAGWQEQARISDVTADPGSFGCSVAIAGDSLIIGAKNKNSSVGSAFVYTRTGTTWTQTQVLLPPGGQNEEFGTSMAATADTLVIGSPKYDNGGASEAGRVFVYIKIGATWAEQQQLFQSDPVTGHGLGLSVAVNADTVIAGTPFTFGATPGAAYAFTRSGVIWTQQQKLLPSDGSNSDKFGCGVAVSGDFAIVGARGKNAAYAFARVAGVWTQEQKLTHFGAVAGDNFGDAVAMAGTIAVVSAPNFSTPTSTVGKACVFVRYGTWIEQLQGLGSRHQVALYDDIVVAGPAIYLLPQAATDNYITDEDTALYVPGAAGVLANDFNYPYAPYPISVGLYQVTSLQGGAVTVFTNGAVSYQPPADFSGVDQFTYYPSIDGTTPLLGAAVVINVNAGNDTPQLTLPPTATTTFETAIVLSGGNAPSVSDSDAGASDIELALSASDGTVTLATLTGLTVTAGADGTAAITVEGTIAEINTALDGMTFTPAAVFSGLATIQFTLDDLGNTGAGGAKTDSGQLVILVDGGDNEAPFVSVPPPQSTPFEMDLVLDGGLEPSVADADASGADIELAITATNGTVTLATTTGLTITAGNDGTATVTVEGTLAQINAALDGLTFTPDAGYSGLASIAFVADDLGNTGTGGAKTHASSLFIDVQEDTPNQAPVLDLPPSQSVAFDHGLTLGGALAVVVSDADAGTSDIELAITCSGGTVALSTTAGLTITAGANSSAAITVQGPIAAINTALNGLVFSPNAGFSGVAEIEFHADDLGNTGASGPQTTTDSLSIFVQPQLDTDEIGRCAATTAAAPFWLLFIGVVAVLRLRRKRARL